MNSIYHQRRILSKRINTLQCKAQRKDQHRKQKRQEIDPPSVFLFFVFFRLLNYIRLSFLQAGFLIFLIAKYTYNTTFFLSGIALNLQI